MIHGKIVIPNCEALAKNMPKSRPGMKSYTQDPETNSLFAPEKMCLPTKEAVSSSNHQFSGAFADKLRRCNTFQKTNGKTMIFCESTQRFKALATISRYPMARFHVAFVLKNGVKRRNCGKHGYHSIEFLGMLCSKFKSITFRMQFILLMEVQRI